MMPKLFGSDDVTITSNVAPKLLFGPLLRDWLRQNQNLGRFRLFEKLNFLGLFVSKLNSKLRKMGEKALAILKQRQKN